MKRNALRAVRKDEVPVPDASPVERDRGWEGVAPLPAVVGRMEQMMEEMFRGGLWGRLGMPWDRLFREVGFGGEGGVKLDMFEDGDALVAKADLPGIMKKNLNIRVIDGTLYSPVIGIMRRRSIVRTICWWNGISGRLPGQSRYLKW